MNDENKYMCVCDKKKSAQHLFAALFLTHLSYFELRRLEFARP